MNIFARVVLAEVTAILLALWIGAFAFHAIEVPNGAWWRLPFSLTVVLGSIGLAVGLGFAIYRLTSGKRDAP
jgi:lysylphosphatidylglycerol synthetase-like protein (DUF2156 family)